VPGVGDGPPTPAHPQPPPVPHGFWPSALRLLVGGDWPPDRDSAARFVDACRVDELLPLLARQASLPDALRNALDRSAALLRLYDERARLFGAARAEVEDLLQGETFLYLKGADYGPRLYGDPALRPMKDIDLLVREGRYGAVCRRLEEGGLQPVFPGAPATRAPRYHERAFALRGLQVEVHRGFVQSSRHCVDYDAVWRRAVIDPGTGRGRLEDVDALTYHALAMGVDQFQARLIRYVDLWLLLERAGAEPAAAVERARSWCSVRALYGALRMLAWLFPESDGEGLRAAREAVLSALERRFVDRWVLPTPGERGRRRLPGRGLQLWRKFALLDGWSRRAAFAAGWARDELAGRLGGATTGPNGGRGGEGRG